MRHIAFIAAAVLSSGAACAAERAITLAPVMAMSWEYLTHSTVVKPRPTLGVGFWQRGSGAKPGVGSNYVGTMEYQLPETAPQRVRSATFQFSGKQSQCSGAEPVVIDVYAYAGDGRGEVQDSSAGQRVAQLRADCATNPAFNQPIDVTALVRQLSVPSGIRHIGFNMRKANNRQGPGIFALSPGKLTIVVSDQDIAQAPAPTLGDPSAGGAPPPTAAGPNSLLKALGTMVRSGNTKAGREQARQEAADGLATLPATPGAPVAPSPPTQ